MGPTCFLPTNIEIKKNVVCTTFAVLYAELSQSYRWYAVVDPVRHERQPVQQVLIPGTQWLEARVCLGLPHRRDGLVEHAANRDTSGLQEGRRRPLKI